MLYKLLKLVVLLPLAFVLLVFAIANRHSVKISLDPFGTAETANLSVSAPLFVIILAAVMMGIVLGSVASRIGTARRRRMQQSQQDKPGARAHASQARQSGATGNAALLAAPR